MSKYSLDLSELMDEEVRSIRSGDYFLTLYIPSREYFKEELGKRIQSQARKVLRANKKIADFSETHQKVIEKILKEYSKLEIIPKGIAFFVRFSAKEQLGHGAEKEVVKMIKMVSLNKEPIKSAYLGKTFELDQLTWVNNTSVEALVLKLDKDMASIYELGNEGVRLLKEIKREMETVRSKEYLGVYTPNKFKKGYFGVASNKVDRELEQAQAEFSRRIVEEMQKDENLQTNYEYLVVFYTEYWREMLETLKQDFKIKLSQLTPLYVSKNLQSEKEMFEESKKQISSFQKQMKKDMISLAKEDFNNYAEGWRKVIKADRLKKIDTLFIKVDSSKEGYVFKKEFLYTYPVKGSRKVKSIVPWLTKNVLDSSGKLVVIKDDKLMPKTEVMAKLRY